VLVAIEEVGFAQLAYLSERSFLCSFPLVDADKLSQLRAMLENDTGS
jgi:hypothetical protein